MKKTYWISDEKKIRNPYYGKEMPDCGNITKTIMPGKEHSMKMNDTMPEKNMNHTCPTGLCLWGNDRLVKKACFALEPCFL